MTSRNEKEFKAIASAISILYKNRSIFNNLPNVWFQHLAGSLISAVTELTVDSRGKVGRRKFFGQPYWSKKAIQRVRENLKNDIKAEKGLHHEHVIPKKYYFKKFEKITDPTPRKIHKILEGSVAAIVTQEEHQKLTDSYSGNKIWERYKGKATIYDLSNYRTRKEQIGLISSTNFQFKKLKRINLNR